MLRHNVASRIKPIEDFLEFKNALGIKYITSAYYLCKVKLSHMIRFHFACANIMKWSNEGKDIHDMLPYL